MPQSLVGARVKVTCENDGQQAVGKIMSYKAPLLALQVEDGNIQNSQVVRLDAFCQGERLFLKGVISGTLGPRILIRPISDVVRTPSPGEMKVLQKVLDAYVMEEGTKYELQVVAGGPTALYYESKQPLPLSAGITLVVVYHGSSVELPCEVTTQSIADGTYAGVIEIQNPGRLASARWATLTN